MFYIVVFTGILGAACSKQLDLPTDRSPFTTAQKAAAALTREVASVLEKVYQDRDAYYEANAAIFSGYYADERVLLKDLLEPDSSALYRSEKFRAFHVRGGIFRQRFYDALNAGDYPLLKKELARGGPVVNASAVTLPGSISSPSAITINTVSIYFPYSEDFTLNRVVKLEQPATIVYSDRDADAGPGREPYVCGTLKTSCYREVTVDDAYASAKPTHIVGMGADVQPKATPVEATATPVNRVYHGWGRLTKQMDKLISLTGNGGGSEVKLGRIGAYLKTSGQQVTSFDGDLVTVMFTRSDIRKKRWKRILSIWNPNWAAADKEEIYAVYEDDTEGTTSFNGSLSTTLSVGIAKVTGQIGFDVKVQTKDDILTQRKYGRASYYKGALMNQGWGFVPDDNDFLDNSLDWPIYDGAAVWQYTLANRQF